MEAIKNKLMTELHSLDSGVPMKHVTKEWVETVHLLTEALCYLVKVEGYVKEGHLTMPEPSVHNEHHEGGMEKPKGIGVFNHHNPY